MYVIKEGFNTCSDADNEKEESCIVSYQGDIDSKNRAEHDHKEKKMMNTDWMLVIYIWTPGSVADKVDEDDGDE